MKLTVCLLAIFIQLSVQRRPLFSIFVEEKIPQACKERYLHSKGLIDSNFLTADYNDTTLSFKCDEIMLQFRDLFSRDLMTVSDYDPYLEGIENCIQEKMKEANMSDIALAQSFYEKSQLAEAKVFFSELNAKGTKTARNAIEVCKAGKIFDNVLMNPTNNEDQKICAKKNLLENNFWSSTEGDLVVPSMECKAVIEILEYKIVHSYINRFINHLTTDAKNQCAEEVIRSSQLFAGLLRAFILKDIGVSDEKKAEERVAFIEKMHNMTVAVTKC